jgi:phage FluMu protein Com
MQDIMKLLEQASYDSVVDIECPQCGAMCRIEPDAENIYCHDCGKETGRNPLVELGYI